MCLKFTSRKTKLVQAWESWRNTQRPQRCCDGKSWEEEEGEEGEEGKRERKGAAHLTPYLQLSKQFRCCHSVTELSTRHLPQCLPKGPHTPSPQESPPQAIWTTHLVEAPAGRFYAESGALRLPPPHSHTPLCPPPAGSPFPPAGAPHPGQ